MKRRAFITLLGGAAAAWPLAARTQQQPTQIPKVGWIFPGASAGPPTELAGFKEGLRELGYVEGKNIVVEYRFGENSVERLPEFATKLAQLNVSVIVALGTFAFRVARHAAPEIPIVVLSADPIGAGIVTNLSRPGGNVTGVSVMRLSGKWPELAKEALAGLSRVGYLINPTNPASAGARPRRPLGKKLSPRSGHRAAGERATTTPRPLDNFQRRPDCARKAHCLHSQCESARGSGPFMRVSEGPKGQPQPS